MDPVKPEARGGVLFYIGAAGLLLVMAIEAVAVAGRHARIPLLGALEMVQAAILPAACASMVIASLAGTHAAVHLITERMPPRPRDWLARISALISALYFAGLFAGASWLTLDYWDSFEESDVLHIPFRPLRILVAVSAGALSLIFLHRCLRGAEKP
jgi:TRAP-type C4-dicarboxylate transport system permease small subunit